MTQRPTRGGRRPGPNETREAIEQTGELRIGRRAGRFECAVHQFGAAFHLVLMPASLATIGLGDPVARLLCHYRGVRSPFW